MPEATAPITFESVVELVRQHRKDYPRSRIRPPKREEFDLHCQAHGVSGSRLAAELHDFFADYIAREEKVLSGEMTFAQAFEVNESDYKRRRAPGPSQTDQELKQGRIRKRGGGKGDISWL